MLPCNPARAGRVTGLEYLLETIFPTAFQILFRHPVCSARRLNGILAIGVQRHTLVVRVISYYQLTGTVIFFPKRL
jgi:hypothetical protein